MRCGVNKLVSAKNNIEHPKPALKYNYDRICKRNGRLCWRCYVVYIFSTAGFKNMENKICTGSFHAYPYIPYIKRYALAYLWCAYWVYTTLAYQCYSAGNGIVHDLF